MNGIETTLIGNVGRDIEISYGGNGNAWTRFGIAVTRFTTRNGERTEKTTWVNAKCFGDQAENLAESVQKGIRVIATGHFESEEWKTKDGEDRKDMVFIVDEIGPSLRWAVAPATKKGGNAGGSPRPASRPAARQNDSFGSDAAPAPDAFEDEENPFL